MSEAIKLESFESLPMIYSSISTCMELIGAVGQNGRMDMETKSGRRVQYSYRKLEDLYNAINPAMRQSGIFMIPTVLEERRTKEGYQNSVVLKMKYDFFAQDGSSVTCVVMNEGQDAGDKAYNKAMSACFKYAVSQVFCIPTEADNANDQDAYRPEVESEKLAETATAPKAKNDASKVNRIQILSETVQAVGLRDLKTNDRKSLFAGFVAEAIEAKVCPNKKTADMSDDEFLNCMDYIKAMHAGAAGNE